MKHQLTDHHKRHLKKIGVSEVSDALHIPFKEYDEHHRAWKRTLPHASDEEIHKRVLANVAWRRQNAQPSAEPVPVVTQTPPAPVHISVDHRKELRWLAAAIAIVALLLLFTGRAHAQFSKISSIQWQQSGSNISGGFVASPFIINCGANMACSASGTTITIASSATAGTAWDSLTNPAAGALTLNQFANGNTFLKVLRKTDSSPTGNFFDFQNAAGSSVCKLDITGLFSSCTFPYGSLTGTPSTFAPTAHNLFSASHGDTVAASPVRGDIIIANSTPAWTKLAIGTTGLYPKSNGTDIVNSTMAASGVGACGANTWASTLNGDAVPTCTQPGFTNISGSVAAGQMPALTGAITTSAGAVATSPGKADLLDSQNFCQAAGASSTTYTCNLSPAISAYVTGTHYRFKADVANTAASTINLNSLGAKTIKKAAGGITTDIAANDLQAGQWVDLVYDGTNMQMQSTLGNAAAGSSGVGTMWAALYQFQQVPLSATRYAVINGVTGVSTNEDNIAIIVPAACTAQNLYVQAVGAAQPGDGSLVFTLRDYTSSTDTAITFTIAAGGAAGSYSDTTHTASLVAGRRYEIKIVNNSSTASSIALYAAALQCK